MPEEKPSSADPLWDEIFDAARTLNSPASILSFCIWLSVYGAVNAVWNLGIVALPVFFLVVILAGGSGVAYENWRDERKESSLRPIRSQVLFQRIKHLYDAANEVLPEDGKPIHQALVGAWSTFESELQSAEEFSIKLDLIERDVIRAQRKFYRLRKDGKLSDDVYEAISRAGSASRRDLDEIESIRDDKHEK